MWDYTYEASNERGELHEGKLSALNVADAVQQLADRGLEVSSIQRVEAIIEPAVATPSAIDRPSLQRLADVIARRQQWLPAIESLLLELRPGPARRATERTVRQLSHEMTIEQFLRSPEGVGLLPLLASDERPTSDSPRLQTWLQQLVQHQRRRIQSLRRWSYPLLLLGITLAVLIAGATFLLPIFREMFSEFGLTLPAPTLLVFWLADQLTIYGPRTLLVVALASAAIIPLARWWRHRALTNWLLGRAVAGTTGNLRAMSRLTGTLAELLGLEIPLGTALRYAGQASGHRYFADAAIRCADSSVAIAAGAGVPVDPTGRLPQSVEHALAAGAEGRPSIGLLRELAAIYGQVAQSRQDRFLSNFHVFGVMLVGCLIGFVVLSLFMPLVGLVSALA